MHNPCQTTAMHLHTPNKPNNKQHQKASTNMMLSHATKLQLQHEWSSNHDNPQCWLCHGLCPISCSTSAPNSAVLGYHLLCMNS